MTLRSCRTLPSQLASDKQPLGAGRQSHERLVEALREAADERRGQIRDVLAPFAQLSAAGSRRC